MIRRVEGRSMMPALHPGDIVFVWKVPSKKGSIVLAKINNREVLKRVMDVNEDSVYLQGDNSFESTDSRHYGPVHKNAILGTVMIVLPKATNPPNLVKPYGHLLGKVAASILVVVSLIHLFRIDTLVPILDGVLPGGQLVASLFSVLVIFCEIFAIPFALRMKLSPLMHLFSGSLMVFAPFFWLQLSIWALGSGQPIGQLGEFIAVYANPTLIVINLLWVGFSYCTLFALGYNRQGIRSLLRK